MASGNDVPTEAGEQAWRQIGQQLREARLARDEDIRSIATYLRIRYDYLAALESGDMVALPGQAYASGFLRSYAAYLGLDGVPMTARLKGPPLSLSPSLRTPGAWPHGSSLRASMLAIAALLLAGTLLFGHGAVEPPWPDPAVIAAPAPLSSILSPMPLRAPRSGADPGQPPLAMLVSAESEGVVTRAESGPANAPSASPRPRR